MKTAGFTCCIAALSLVSTAARAQELIGLRIEGPDQVIEKSVTFYRVFAEFDNGQQYEVTLFAELSVDPGVFARIGKFGDLETLEVQQNVIETVKGKFEFQKQSKSAELEVTIIDVGPAGFALEFDGKDDFVKVARTPDLEPTELTVEAWIKPHSSGERNTKMFRNEGDDGHGGGFILSFQEDRDRRIQLVLRDRGNDMARIKDSDEHSRYFDDWHHVAAVYSGAGGFARLYVDGVLKGSGSGFPRIISYAGNHDIQFGRGPGTDGNYNGRMDEIRFWSIARRASEIRCTMNVRLRGDEPGLIGYWRFDEAAGQVVHDLSPFGHDGILGDTSDPEGNPGDPVWTLSDAPIEEGRCEPVDCDLIQKFKLKCRNNTLQALLKSKLDQGTKLWIDDNGRLEIMIINAKGRGKVKWTEQTGIHTVFIDDCPEHVKAVNCGP